MDTEIDLQRELIHLLRNRLKQCALESMAFHAMLLNFPEETQARARELLEYYRQSEPFQQKLETQFHDLDSLIQKLDEGIENREMLLKLLERFDPGGKPN